MRAELKRESELEQGGAVNRAIHVDKVYERSQYTTGTPLNDSFHFGQTIVDDFGRPFGHGLQQIAGFESRAESGRFSFYVRGEYQHTPTIPGYGAALNQVIAAQDRLPAESFAGVQSRDQFRLLDTYASLNILSNEISVGKQTFFWGPDDSTALMFSDNAEPIYALRINRTLPLYIPLLSKLTGPIRYDNYFGRIAGTGFPPDPFTYGQKISLHPTKNLELGFSRNAMFAGRGLEPLTFHTFFKSFTSFSSGTTAGFNPRDTPGTRHGGFDFRYRLPGVRDWLTLYADSFVARRRVAARCAAPRCCRSRYLSGEISRTAQARSARRGRDHGHRDLARQGRFLLLLRDVVHGQLHGEAQSAGLVDRT